MGRKAKYATLRQYQPYIDIIRADLNIPTTFPIQWQFKNVKRVSGEAFCYKDSARIVVANFMTHIDTLTTIIHELRHIQQRLTGRLVYIKDNRELWENKEYIKYRGTRKDEYSSYTALPWEVDARAYEKEITRLFPKYQLPVRERREFIGSIGQSKYYRMQG